MLCSVLAPNMLKRHGWAGEGPGKGHKDDQRIGKLTMQGKAEGTGMLSLNKKCLREFQSLNGYKEDVGRWKGRW